MSSGKLREALDRLLAKTRGRAANWQQFITGGPKPAPVPSCFAITLKDSVITIANTESLSAPNRITFSYRDKHGIPAKEYQIFEGEDDWDLANDLFEMARVTALGLNNILEEVERAIMNEEPIGFGPGQR